MLTLRSRSARAAALTAAALVATPVLIGSATAAAPATAAVGSAGASISLLRVDNATASLRALTASLNSSTATSPHTASVSVTPVWSSASGAVGQVTVTPADSPKHVGAGSLALPSGLASLSSPAIDVVANVANGTATAGITGGALGAITVLGKPLQIAGGALNLSSNVTKTSASSTKSVTVDQLALPTIADLLASLGLDVAKLAQDQLMALFAIVQSTAGATLADAVNTANAAVDAAQVAAGSAASTISAAQGVLASRQADLATAQSDATAAQAALASAQSSFDSAIAPVNAVISSSTPSLLQTTLAGAGITSPFSATSWQAMSGATKTTVDAAINTAFGPGTSMGIDAAAAAVAAANTALAAANAAVAAAQALVDAAQALVAALLDLVNAVVAALDADPLATLGGIDAGTQATASKTAAADGHLSVGTVEVLGLTQAVGNLTSALGSVTSALAGVLNGITGVTFTPPSISVGNVSKVTSVDKGTASALVTVSGVKITLPTLKLPTTLGLAGGASLPGIDLVNGALQSIAGTVTVAELRDSATFTQAGSVPPNTPGTPGGTPTGGGSLPTTGAPAALGLLALATIGFAVLLRRRAHSRA